MKALPVLVLLVSAPTFADEQITPPKPGTPFHAQWCEQLNGAARSLSVVLDMAMKETPGRGNPKADAFASQVTAVLLAEKLAACPATKDWEPSKPAGH